MPDIKATFIQKCLNDYFNMSSTAMKMAAIKKKVGISNDGINSISHTVLQQGSGAVGKLSFKEYLRMVDMGVGRGHPLGGLKAMKVVLQSKNQEGIAFVKDNTRKTKKIYASPVYKNLGWLQNKLLYGFTEETITSLKQELENGTSGIVN